MSNQKYRTPPKSWAQAEGQPQDPATTRRLELVKQCLEKILEHTMTGMDKLAAIPTPPDEHSWPKLEWEERKQKMISAIARIALAACRGMLQVFKHEGNATSQLAEVMEQTAEKLAQRLEKQAPQLAQAG